MSNLVYPSPTVCEHDGDSNEAAVPVVDPTPAQDLSTGGEATAASNEVSVALSESVSETHSPAEPQVKPKRPPSQIEWVCIWLESALGASEELADLTEDMRFRLYGQGDDYRDPGDIPPDTAILPRLHILATRLQQQALRAEKNLADIGQIA